MTKKERPLSPHLMIYKPQITSVLSITHRMTGVALSAGLLLIVWWLAALVCGPEMFETVQTCMRHWTGQIVLIGFSWALFYHLSNGIRHLFWDMGYGFEMVNVHRSGWAVVILSVLLTASLWALIYSS